MRVISIVEQAFATAMLPQRELQERWIKWSMRMVARTGHDMPRLNQSDYHLDLLIRALEAEHAARYSADPDGVENDPLILSDAHLFTLSRLWFLGMYETIRTIRKASSARSLPDLEQVYSAMHVVRIAIAKNQIATVKGQKMRDMFMEAHGEGPPSIIKYDPQKANYRPVLIFDPTTGSTGWNVVDLEKQVQRNVTRLEFSNAILALADAPEVTPS